ncbi:uncharacterized protein LOC125948209 [Anopheles darlingi]|uniref:uncharacterized protein LOC125948209 n=1 Tax=Anopheles darlingi TaxID=43151 RepID=UPI0021003E72|nr:uncharacterized protein LOC125948209 [Anopheles darlingi]
MNPSVAVKEEQVIKSELETETDVDEGDYDEEEMLVFVDFEPYLSLNNTRNPNVQLIGLEENPIIQIDGETYRGTYDYAFGTYVFFEKDPEWNPSSDSLFDTPVKQMYRYVDKSNKVLRMKRIFLTEKEPLDEEKQAKDEVSSEAECSSEPEEDQREKFNVAMSYEAALNQHLSEGSTPPRHIPEQQNGADIINRIIQ